MPLYVHARTAAALVRVAEGFGVQSLCVLAELDEGGGTGTLSKQESRELA